MTHLGLFGQVFHVDYRFCVKYVIIWYLWVLDIAYLRDSTSFVKVALFFSKEEQLTQNIGMSQVFLSLRKFEQHNFETSNCIF